MKASSLLVRAALVAALAPPAALVAQPGTVVGGGLTGPGVVEPTSYAMLNGNTGAWRYLDYIYPDPDAGTDNGPLSGGLGLLTNGIAATTNWNTGSAVPAASPFHGTYVGWTIDPTITFSFAQPYDFTNVRIHFDIANSGGVGAPGPVTINGIAHPVTLPGGTDPFWEDFDISALAPTNTLVIGLTRTNSWLMVSEFDFGVVVTPTAAPEPATLALVGLGLVGVGAVARRRSAVR